MDKRIMARKNIEPVEWTSGVAFVKVPTEMLEAITRCETQGHVDKLCGAYVRYCMSQKREEVPKSIREQYNMLIPIADRIINGMRTGGIRNGRVAEVAPLDLHLDEQPPYDPYEEPEPYDDEIDAYYAGLVEEQAAGDMGDAAQASHSSVGQLPVVAPPRAPQHEEYKPYSVPLKGRPFDDVLYAVKSFAEDNDLAYVLEVEGALENWAWGHYEKGWNNKYGKTLDGPTRRGPDTRAGIQWQDMLMKYDERMRERAEDVMTC